MKGQGMDKVREALAERHPTMRDADMPLADRIRAAMKRISDGHGMMRIPVEATDPDIVLHDCLVEIERLASSREALSAQPAEPVELGDRFMEILRAIHGDMPDDFADSARLAFVHATKVTQPAPSVPAGNGLEVQRLQRVWEDTRTQRDELLAHIAGNAPLPQWAADWFRAGNIGHPTPSVPAVPEGWQLLRDTTSEERSWPDDASHENGSYFNTCVHCLRGFIGHKRRVVCRVCAAPHPAAKGGAT